MIGRKLKNYQIEELLGEGGMGVVYRARDLNLERMVAIKMLHPEMLHQPDLLKRFRNEAHVTARLSHPNIATLFNFFSEDNLHCLVMEYVNGKTLEQVLETHKQLPEQECVKILIQLLEGLEEAHHNEILHRDIKPGNIMINRSGYVKLMDFGVARFENSARITRMNRVIGTLEYMAPELLTGSKPSVSADIYSAGVVAYEMYTGKLPFEGAGDTDIIELILKGKFSFSSRGGSLNRRNSKLENIISRLMHKSQTRRYATAREVINDLAKLHYVGRVSTALLSNQKLVSETPPAESKTIFQFNKSLDEYSAAATKIYQTYSPKVIAFFKTTEGQIIGGAIGIALIIMLLAGLISGSSNSSFPDRVVESQNDEMALLEPVQQERAADLVTPGGQARVNNPSQTPVSRNQGNVEDNYSAPAPIVVNPGRDNQANIRSQESHGTTGESEANSNRGQTLSPEDQSDADQNRSSAENEQIDEENPHRQDTIINHDEVTEEPNISNNTATGNTPSRSIEVNAANVIVSAQFSESVSTNSHRVGDIFYLITTGAVYADGYKIIDAGARVRGKVQNATSGDGTRRGRAFLAVTFDEVQAVDGSWLPIIYPEYSDRGGEVVTFARGTTLNRLRIASGRVSLGFE
jgi:eukaryotic-like serine/threonine-protein kinase